MLTPSPAILYSIAGAVVSGSVVSGSVVSGSVSDSCTVVSITVVVSGTVSFGVFAAIKLLIITISNTMTSTGSNIRSKSYTVKLERVSLPP